VTEAAQTQSTEASLTKAAEMALKQLQSEVTSLKTWVGPWDSVIISDFPEIFAEFRGKQFSLLWRGGRDGFGARDFHDRCDGHANTLTLIEDTDGNIFGAFTPVKWESNWSDRAVPARRFGLRAEKGGGAIYCHSGWGPCFYDIHVCDYCNACNSSTTSLGSSYTNDTGRYGKTVFTGWQYFQADEIEVFEITD
jgi:hypothetical protein